jgi:thioredoxin reductase (NADPH)
MRRITMERIIDLAIIGGGPAGLSAALYAGRAKLDTVIFEKEKMGGQIVTTQEVANVPGSLYNEGSTETTGPKLIARMVAQAEEFGTERVMDEIIEVDFSGDIKVLKGNKGEYKARAVIIAAGAFPRKLGVPGEKKLTGKGVSYCATCDGAFFTDLDVFVVGGGYSAAEEGMFLTKFAETVTILVRDDKFNCAPSVVDKVMANEKIEVKFNHEIVEIKGDGLVESAILRNRETGEEYEYFADEEVGTFGIFPFIGFQPDTEIFKGKVELDDWGYIKTDSEMRTNIEGVYAAGDIRPKVLRQVVTASSDGAIAATMAEKYIEEKFHG